MRDQGAIRARIKTLLVEELQDRVREAQRRLPHLCVHNHAQIMDSTRELDGESNPGYNRLDRRHLPVASSVGLCMLGAEDIDQWPGNICDEPLDAQRCPYFEAKLGKAELLSVFRTQVQSVDWLTENMPEVASLVWVLGDTPANHHLPWWARWWFWSLRLRKEPLQPHLLVEGVLDGDRG